MPPVETLGAFFVASVVMGLAPGPDILFVLTQSALYGAADMPLTKESQMEAIRKNGKPAFVESNLNCFERGFKAASEETAKD